MRKIFNNKKKMFKHMSAAVSMAALLIVGINILSTKVNAADFVEISNGVGYVCYDNDAFKEFRGTDSYKAPEYNEKLFGGWYKDVELTTPLTETEVDSYEESVYAKFVPSYVLSVKTQYGEITDDAGNDGLRLISSVDGTNYAEVGYTIYTFNDEDRAWSDTKLTTVYDKILVGETEYTAKTMFGAAAEDLFIYPIKVPKSCENDVIYVCPYWKTMDGTVVEGLAKYVRLADVNSDKTIISIPVNVSTAEAIAAGKLQITYDSTYLTYSNYIQFGGTTAANVPEGQSYGTSRLLENLVVNAETAGTIYCVGYANDMNETIVGNSDVYINLLFELTNEGQTAWSTSDADEFLTFTVSGVEFCNGKEEAVEFDTDASWTIQY